MENSELQPMPEKQELEKVYTQFVVDAINKGYDVMPLLARSQKAAPFLQSMTRKMPPDSQFERQEKWKEEYSIGLLKISFPEIYIETLRMPKPMQGLLARKAVEEYIMPGVQAEMRGNIPEIIQRATGIKQVVDALNPQVKIKPPTNIAIQGNSSKRDKLINAIANLNLESFEDCDTCQNHLNCKDEYDTDLKDTILCKRQIEGIADCALAVMNEI